ncbi:MAG: hypothetical protein AB8B93_08880 [Pseudomonadales bacterium]
MKLSLNQQPAVGGARVGRLTTSLCITLLLMLGMSNALAEVALSNDVQKVETFVDSDGSAQRRLVDVDSVVPGDELRYTIHFVNNGSASVDAGSIIITNPIPDDTEYLDGTAFGSGTNISFSADAGSSFGTPDQLTVIPEGSLAPTPAAARDYTTIRWEFTPTLAPGEASHVSFNVRLK